VPVAVSQSYSSRLAIRYVLPVLRTTWKTRRHKILISFILQTIRVVRLKGHNFCNRAVVLRTGPKSIHILRCPLLFHGIRLSPQWIFRCRQWLWVGRRERQLVGACNEANALSTRARHCSAVMEAGVIWHWRWRPCLSVCLSQDCCINVHVAEANRFSEAKIPF